MQTFFVRMLKRYNLGSYIDSRLISDSWNLGYKLKTSKGTYFVKIKKLSTDTEFTKEIRLNEYLNKTIPLPRIVANNTNKLETRVGNKRLYIQEFVIGKVLGTNYNISSNVIKQLAKNLAKINNVKAPAFMIKTNPINKIIETLKKIPKDVSVNKIVNIVEKYLQKTSFYTTKFPNGLIHFDLHTNNILVNKGRIVAILDMETVLNSSFIFDLGWTLFDICFDKNGNFIKERFNLFISNYKKYRKITKIENENLLNAMMFAALVELHYYVIKEGVHTTAYKKDKMEEKIQSLLKILDRL